MTAVHLEYRFTCDHFLEAAELHWQTGHHPVWTVLLGIAGIFSLLYGVFDLQSGGLRGTYLIILGLLFLLGPSISRRLSSKRQFAERPDANCLMRFDINEDGFHLNLDGKRSASLPWRRIRRATVTSRGMLIYQSENTFFYLPREIFPGREEFRSVKGLFEVHVNDFVLRG
jgi:hypothetical protein